MTFEVGDRVVYPPQGGGTIMDVVEREIQGASSRYLKVVFIRGDMEVLVPLDRALEVGLRRTLSPQEFTRLEEEFHTDSLDLPAQWPPRFRVEQDILNRGDAFELARLIGLLHVREQERGLASTEREVLEGARALLASELAVVRSESLAQGETWIDAALAAGAA